MWGIRFSPVAAAFSSLCTAAFQAFPRAAPGASCPFALLRLQAWVERKGFMGVSSGTRKSLTPR